MVQWILRLIRKHEFIRFGIVGGIAAGLHFGIYYLLLALAVPYNIAYTAGYILSLCFNFWASTVFTFRTGANPAKGIKFLLSHGINYLMHIGLLNLYVWLGVSEKLAPVLVLAVAVPINFLLVRISLKGVRTKKGKAAATPSE